MFGLFGITRKYYLYMKTLILDYSTWRCGYTSPYKENRLGEGETRLLNTEGYMCCLGQFTPQLEPTIKKEDILDKDVPSQLNKHIPDFTFLPPLGGYSSTLLVNSAITINDNHHTTVAEKIKSLKALFKKYGYTIRVINRPKK